MLKIHTISTSTSPQTTEQSLQAPDYNELLKAFAKNPSQFKEMSLATIKYLSLHLHAKRDNYRTIELKHILYAGMLLRYFGSRGLDAATLDRLRDISGIYLDLKDFLKVSDNKFYADAFTVALDSMQYVLQNLVTLWTIYRDKRSDEGFSKLDQLEILAHKYCDSYNLMLNQVHLLSSEKFATKQKQAATFLMEFPFRNHLRSIEVPEKSIAIMNNSYIYAMFYLTGIDDHRDAGYSERLKQIVKVLLGKKSSLPHVLKVCAQLLHFKLGDSFVQNLMSAMLICIKHNELGDDSFVLLDTMKRKFSAESISKFDQMLSKDVQFQGYQSDILRYVYDLHLGLKRSKHILYQIKQFVHKFHADIEVFFAGYRRKTAKDQFNKHIANLIEGSIGFAYIDAIWNNNQIIDGSYTFGLDSRIKRQLACMDIYADKLSITSENMKHIIQQIIIVAKLSYEYDNKLEHKARINTLGTYESIYDAVEQLLAALSAPGEITRLSIEPAVKSKSTSEPGFWLKKVDAVIQHVGRQQWIFWDPSLEHPIQFSSKNINIMVKHIVGVCRTERVKMSTHCDLDLVQAPLVFYPKTKISTLVFSNRRAQTPYILDEERGEAYDFKPLVKSDSSPNFGSVKFSFDG